MSDVVERAKAALEGVTEGPWTFGVRNSRTVQIVPGDRPSLLRPEPGLAGIALARPNDAEFVAAARTLVPELVAEIGRLRRERIEFVSRLDFGDDIHEPAAELADIVDAIEAAFSDGRDHQECPHCCEHCGESLAATPCPECHGSGCNAALCEVSGAYSECEHCGGAGWLHDGCVGMGYAELAAEVERLRARRITTFEELDTLTEGTLIQAEHRPLVYVHRGGYWHSLVDRYDRESRVLPLPVLVLWEPDEANS